MKLSKLTWKRPASDTWTTGDFTVKRWMGYPCGHVSPGHCYMVQYQGECLTNLIKWSQPHDLAEAKRQAQQYSDLLAIRSHRST